MGRDNPWQLGPGKVGSWTTDIEEKFNSLAQDGSPLIR
jgi:hypothetical protein